MFWSAVKGIVLARTRLRTLQEAHHSIIHLVGGWSLRHRNRFLINGAGVLDGLNPIGRGPRSFRGAGDGGRWNILEHLFIYR